MSEPREFPNPYQDYDNRKQLMDVNDPTKWPKEIRDSLQTNLIRLLKQLESDLEHNTDWYDYSVYTGTSGISLLYVHLSVVLDGGGRDNYFKKALYYIEPCLSRLKGRRNTFLCGDAGPLAIAAVLYSREGKIHQSEEMISRLVKIGRNVIPEESDSPDELLFGRVGYLYALLFVQKYVGMDSIDHDLIRQVVAIVIKSGKRMSKQEDHRAPLMYSWHEKHYLGAAHGLTGILYMLLQAKDYMSSEDLNLLVKPSINFLLHVSLSSGNFPSSIGNNTDRLIHWCHGAPGVIHLLGLGYRVFQDQKYLDFAKQCGEVIWKRGLLRKGYGLCHGASGNGYAFLILYQLTNEKKHLWRALKFAEWCCDFGKHGCRIPDRPLSLFEGLAGSVYFLADMLAPDKAAFPAFQLFQTTN